MDKYNEVLERAKKMYSENCETCNVCLEQLFPELCESEDEKIRQYIIDCTKRTIEDSFIKDGFTKAKVLAWLEKQKPAEKGNKGNNGEIPNWGEEDEKIASNLVSELGNLLVRGLIKKETHNKYVDWLKSKKR